LAIVYVEWRQKRCSIRLIRKVFISPSIASLSGWQQLHHPGPPLNLLKSHFKSLGVSFLERLPIDPHLDPNDNSGV
jgi:hypothetical protein